VLPLGLVTSVDILVAAPPPKAPTASADKLRDELVECDKLRAGFLKWKLLLIAVLGGTALSGKAMDGEMQPAARTFVLLLVPFVCVYADLLCLQNALRVVSIRRFICKLADESTDVEPSIRYEQHLGDGFAGIYSMESFLLYWSTLLVDMMVSWGGVLQPGARAWTSRVVAFQVAAAAGVVIAVVVGFVFRGHLENISRLFPYKGADVPNTHRVAARLAFGTLVALCVIGVGPSLLL
jgi:hypothetical protein